MSYDEFDDQFEIEQSHFNAYNINNNTNIKNYNFNYNINNVNVNMRRGGGPRKSGSHQLSSNSGGLCGPSLKPIHTHQSNDSKMKHDILKSEDGSTYVEGSQPTRLEPQAQYYNNNHNSHNYNPFAKLKKTSISSFNNNYHYDNDPGALASAAHPMTPEGLKNNIGVSKLFETSVEEHLENNLNTSGSDNDTDGQNIDKSDDTKKINAVNSIDNNSKNDNTGYMTLISILFFFLICFFLQNFMNMV